MEKNANVLDLTPEQLSQRRENCKRHIDRAMALSRLQEHADFKTVIESYLEDEAIRLVHLLGDQSINMGDKKTQFREDIQERLVGISRLSEYFRQVYNLANQAQKELDGLAEAEAEFYNKQ